MLLVGFDIIGILLLVLGLAMQFAPDTGLAHALPAIAKLPLLMVGGGLFAACQAALTLSILKHHRS